MSILLVDPDETLGAAIVERLVAEEDEVRILIREPGPWAARPVYVAAGDPMDADLVERACTNVRTIVFTFTGRKIPLSLIAEVVPAAARAGTDRVVVCTPRVDENAVAILDGSAVDYVVLITGRQGVLPARRVGPDDVARAVSVADDMAGEPKLVVDLTSEEGWKELGAHA